MPSTNKTSGENTVLRRSIGLSEEMAKAIEKTHRETQALIQGSSQFPEFSRSAKYRNDLYKIILEKYKELGNQLSSKLGKAIDKTNTQAAKQMSASIGVGNKPYPLTKDALITTLDGKNVTKLVAVATQNIGQSGINALRNAAVRVFQKGAVEGWNDNEIQKNLQSEWDAESKDNNNFRFVDKRGTAWENARYLQMLTRTTLAKVHRNSEINTLTENGHDLARISSDGGGEDECKVCSAWEGKIISLTGATQGLPTLKDAEEAGVFHPNCVHRLEYVDEDDEEAKQYLKTRKNRASKANRPESQSQKETEPQKAKPPAINDPRNPDILPEKLPDKIKVVSSLGGSTGAKLVEIDGRRYVMKKGNSADHVQSEAQADNAYSAMGLRVPACRIYNTPNGLVKLSNFLEGKSLHDWMAKATIQERTDILKKLEDGFDVDCMLGNWDVLGANDDNIMVDKDGNPWRIDNGGAMSFRAQGTKKKPEEWESGWPDDIFSMPVSSYNKQKFGNITTQQITHKIVARDWSKLKGVVSDEDYNIIQERLAKILKLDQRAVDYEAESYTQETTSQVMKYTYGLEKAGFDKTMPKTCSYGNYSAFRPKQSSAQSSNYDFGAIKTAAISINHHIKTGDFKPTMSSVNDALTLKSTVEGLANSGNAVAKSLLSNIKEIEESQKNGFKTNIGMVNQTIVPRPQSAQKIATAVSPANQMLDYAKKEGIEAEFLRVQEYFDDQGGSSWTLGACKLKVVALASRGKDWKNPQNLSKEYYFGGGSPGLCSKSMQSAIDYYSKNPKKLEEDIKGLSLWRSGTREMLENTSFSGNIQNEKVLLVCRASNRNVIVNANTKIGEVSAPIPIGAHESSAIFKPTVVSGSHGAIFRVPWSRIDSCFFFQRTDGGSLYLGDGEKEIGADLSSLPAFYIGDVKSEQQKLGHPIEFGTDVFGTTGKTYIEIANSEIKKYMSKHP